MSPSVRIALATSVTLIAVVVSAAPAAARVYTGQATSGTDNSIPAGRDLVGLSASFDDETGEASAELTFRGPPASSGEEAVAAQFGPSAAGQLCSEPYGLVATRFDLFARWIHGDDEGDASATVDGSSITVRAVAPAFAGLPFRCASALVTKLSDDTAPVDVMDAPIKLEPVLAPAKLAIRTAPVGLARVKPGRMVKILARVSNPGERPARSISVRASAGKGLRVKPARTRIKRIAPGSARKVKLKVMAGRKARGKGKVRIRATGSPHLKAAGKVAVKVVRQRRRKHGPRGGSGKGLAGTYFWRFITRPDMAWDNRGLAFVDSKWAYRGFPPKGLPHCVRKTAIGDGDGCLRYGFDANSGKVKVGGASGTFRKGRLELDGDSYYELSIPKAGSRYRVALVNQGFSGYCGLITGCTTWTTYLTLTRKGEFALSKMSISTMGGGGAPFTAGWDAPPNQYGTYRIGPRGRIRLAYADGSVEFKTIGIELGKKRRPDPAGTGLLLGETNFYPDGDG